MPTSRTHTLRRIALAIVLLVAGGAAWLSLAPQQIGGPVTYVATAGTSMLPDIERGDLVLVRSAAHYEIGDVAAYRSEKLGTTVLHRIVGREGSGFVFKGDNNDFIDPERPTEAQIVGTLWLHVPYAGRVLALRQALVPALVALTVVLLLGGFAATHRRRRNRRRREAASEASATPRTSAPLRPAQPILALSAILVTAALALGAMAYGNPSSRTSKTDVFYDHAGTFAYSAPAPPGPVYPDGRVDTGETVFARLVARLDVRFDYRFGSRDPHVAGGDAMLVADLANSNGWSRTIVLQPQTRFSGDRLTLRGTLRLRSIYRLLRQVESSTGVKSPTHTLTLTPSIRLRGILSGDELESTFAPELEFALDSAQLRPTLETATTGPESEGSAADPFEPKQTNNLVVDRVVPATVPLPGPAALEVSTARLVAPILAAAGLIGLFVGFMLLALSRKADESTRIRARYDRLLIPVARSDRRSYDEVVEVTSMEALVRIAERYDRMILHEETKVGDTYRIADEGVLYVYSPSSNGSIPFPPVTSEAERSLTERPPPRSNGAASSLRRFLGGTRKGR